VKRFCACEPPDEHRLKPITRRKSLIESHEKPFSFCGLSTIDLPSVDKPFWQIFQKDELPSRGSTTLKNVKHKTNIYLYDYAENFTPLDLVEQNYFHTMPKF
jgi:hypothetical protein